MPEILLNGVLTRDACPTKSVAAHEMEQAVVDHLRGLGKDRQVLRRTLTALRQQNEARQEKGRADLRNLERESKRLNEELVELAGNTSDNASDRLDRMADIQDRLPSLP